MCAGCSQACWCFSSLGYETAEIRCDCGTEKGACVSTVILRCESAYAVCSVGSWNGTCTEPCTQKGFFLMRVEEMHLHSCCCNAVHRVRCVSKRSFTAALQGTEMRGLRGVLAGVQDLVVPGILLQNRKDEELLKRRNIDSLLEDDDQMVGGNVEAVPLKVIVEVRLGGCGQVGGRAGWVWPDDREGGGCGLMRGRLGVCGWGME